jgi:hypothetical protein
MEGTLIRTYSEMAQVADFEGRFEYLELGGAVGAVTFGFDRHINQQFYRSQEWKSIRNYVISRDNGCDLGVPGYEIGHELLIHHINPMQPHDLVQGEEWILDPEYLITTCLRTHNAIHYGNRSLLPGVVLERTANDTKLW